MQETEPGNTGKAADGNLSKEQPPLFSSWKAWYMLVLGNLIALIMIFYWLTLYFS